MEEYTVQILTFSRFSRRRLVEIWKSYSYELLLAKDIKEIESVIRKYEIEENKNGIQRR